MPRIAIPSGAFVGAGAGLASALLFYSAARGTPGISAALLVLTHLPMLLAGLGWGLPAAGAGALATAVVVLFTNGVWPALGTTVSLGLPVVGIVYFAFLSRALGSDPTEREWYPPGRLVTGIALYGGALPLLMLPLSGSSYEDLRAPLAELVRRFSKESVSELGLRPMSEAQIQAAVNLIVTTLPGFIAVYWTAIMCVNTYVAARIVRASGRLARAWSPMPDLRLPKDTLVIFGIALLACYATGLVAIAGVSLTGSLLFAFFLTGLALIHSIARRRSPLLLILLYLALLFAVPYVAILLIIGGLADTLVDLKRRLGGLPPAANPS